MKRAPLVTIVSLVFTLHQANSSSLSHPDAPSVSRDHQRPWGLFASSNYPLGTTRGGSEAEASEDEVGPTGLEENKDRNEAAASQPTSSIHERQFISSNPYRFSLYQAGDGSEEDPDGIPLRFLLFHRGATREEAKAKLEDTLKWRQENDVDTILARPHPHYDICKAISLHSFLGRDDSGHVVFFQRPAVGVREHFALSTRYNQSNHDLLLHYVYILEYCWNILDPPDTLSNSTRVMTSILDLTGLDLGILRCRDLIGFVQQFVSMMSNHYPQRSYKTLLLNAPSWFGLLYKLISPLLRESTKEKVSIYSNGKKQVQVLRQTLGDKCLKYLPAELLETDRKKHIELAKANLDQPLPISPMEKELREFCCARLQEAGLEMKPIIT